MPLVWGECYSRVDFSPLGCRLGPAEATSIAERELRARTERLVLEVARDRRCGSAHLCRDLADSLGGVVGVVSLSLTGQRIVRREAHFLQVPRLVVVVPSSPRDAAL